MKIVLHLEIDEEEVNVSKESSKSQIKLELTKALHNKLNQIDDNVQIYELIEDKRDRQRRE